MSTTNVYGSWKKVTTAFCVCVELRQASYFYTSHTFMSSIVWSPTNLPSRIYSGTFSGLRIHDRVEALLSVGEIKFTAENIVSVHLRHRRCLRVLFIPWQWH